ncbi:MAG: hypothetical protein H7844_12610 [Nitrospirae bacterium YQR-1]
MAWECPNCKRTGPDRIETCLCGYNRVTKENTKEIKKKETPEVKEEQTEIIAPQQKNEVPTTETLAKNINRKFTRSENIGLIGSLGRRGRYRREGLRLPQG